MADFGWVLADESLVVAGEGVFVDALFEGFRWRTRQRFGRRFRQRFRNLSLLTSVPTGWSGSRFRREADLGEERV